MYVYRTCLLVVLQVPLADRWGMFINITHILCPSLGLKLEVNKHLLTKKNSRVKYM